jgi:acetyltransferase-like isoleucine patch superfamily enzyme
MRRLIERFTIVLEWLASEWAKAIARLRFGRSIHIGKRVRLRRGVRIEIFDGGTIEIRADSRIGPHAILGARGGKLTIGSSSSINFGCVIVSTCAIEIGDHTLIAEHVTIRDQDHAHYDPDRPFRQQGRVESPIKIGSNVWLGAKVTVTRGTSICSNTIVGANSVITRHIDRAGKYAGAPARLIRKLGTQK